MYTEPPGLRKKAITKEGLTLNEMFIFGLTAATFAGISVSAALIISLIIKNSPKWVRTMLWGLVAASIVCPMAISAAGYHGAQSSDMQADVPAGIIDAAPKVIVDMDTADDGEYIFFTPHRECADGCWIANGHTYKYRLELTGRLGSAACDTTYLVLSNTKDITFRQAMLASGLGSRTDDYFDIDYALIVGIK